jgi:hypothetical protein
MYEHDGRSCSSDAGVDAEAGYFEPLALNRPPNTLSIALGN